MTPHKFLEMLAVYCSITDASVTSYGRTRHHNDEVGGVEHSAHLAWLGADVVYDGPFDVADRKELGERLGLRVIVESDHDHLQPLGWRKG